MTNRTDYTRGLRDLADFLEAHPDVPLGDAGQTLTIQNHCLSKGTAAKVAWFDAAVAAAGDAATAVRRSHGSTIQHVATVTFGPIEFSAVAITDAWDCHCAKASA
jgi:hypothetical protein